VFNRLPQYELKIEQADALQGVLSGQYDIAVNNYDIPLREQNPTTSRYHIKPASTNTFREPAMSR